jgi:hypothetical protein
MRALADDDRIGGWAGAVTGYPQRDVRARATAPDAHSWKMQLWQDGACCVVVIAAEGSAARRVVVGCVGGRACVRACRFGEPGLGGKANQISERAG